jgi:hypothetical protein
MLLYLAVHTNVLLYLAVHTNVQMLTDTWLAQVVARHPVTTA